MPKGKTSDLHPSPNIYMVSVFNSILVTWVRGKWKYNSSSLTRKKYSSWSIEQSRRWSFSSVWSQISALTQKEKIHPLQGGFVLPVPASKKHSVSVWKIDIVDNIIEQASSINSVVCVHLGFYHRAQGHILTYALSPLHSYKQTKRFWYEGASVLSSQIHLQIHVHELAMLKE